MKQLWILTLLAVVGCGAAAFIPAILPYASELLDEVIDYVVGDTTEAEFLKDLADHPDDPAQVIWQQANRSLINPQSKYVLAVEDSLGVTDRVVGLTFRDSTLFKLNWTDPDTVLEE